MFIKAAEAKEVELAKKYEDIAKKFQEAIELKKQAAEAYQAGKEDEGISFYWAGDYMNLAAEVLIKAVEAQDTGKNKLAEKYQEAADKYEEASKLRNNASIGNKKQAYSLDRAGKCAFLKAEALVKATEAKEVELAKKYEDIAKKFQEAIELRKEAAEAYQAGKEDEGKSLDLESKSIFDSMIKALEILDSKRKGDYQ